MSWTERVLRNEARQGIRVSLHSGDPGNDGRMMVAGPFAIRPTYLRIEGGELINGYDVIVGQARRGGRASHVGVWSHDGYFIRGGRMPRPRQLEPGAQIRFRRGALRIRFRS